MICKICGQEMKNKGITSHLRKHKISDKEYYDIYVKTASDGICKTCGKPTKFFGNISGYGKYCGPKCAQLDPDTRHKCEQTCISKYGASNVYASEYGKERIKETCIKKYGTEYALQSKEVKDHIKETNIERYGVENPQQNDAIKEKTKQTNLEKYGSSVALHSPEIWKKAVHTMKKNGNYSKLEDILEKFFIENNIEYISQYKEERYPFHCDFYLPKIDQFIEINGYWHHNNHFYDKLNEKDQIILKTWEEKSKTKPQYKIAIEVWTHRDINKLDHAIANNLNYLVLWSKEDVEQYIKNFTYHIN